MTWFVVLYMAGLEGPFGHKCRANNADEAEDILLANDPDVDIVWVVETDSYEKALEDYHG